MKIFKFPVNRPVQIGLGVIFLVQGRAALCHKGIDHSIEAKPQVADPSKQDRVQRVIEDYRVNVHEILMNSCGDCHSNQTKYPWYAEIPLVKELIRDDIAEARKHLDISKGFPFEGHGSPLEDLDAIRNTLTEGTMPPWNYSLLHARNRMKEGDKKKVLQWVQTRMIEFNK